MATTASVLASAVNTYTTGLIDTLDSEATPLADWVGLKDIMTRGGGDTVYWPVRSAGNTSTTTFVENDAPSAAGNDTFYTLEIAKSSYQYRSVDQITGTAVDSVKGGNWDAVNRRLTDLVKAHDSYLEDATVTAYEAAVASGGSYAGQTRANANTASMEAAVTPTLDQMATAWDAMVADPRSAPMAELEMLAPSEFITSYGDAATGQTAFEYNAVQTGGIDAGRQAGGDIAYNKKRFTTIPTMTNTTMLFLSKNNVDRFYWRHKEVQTMARNDDSVTVNIISVIVPVVWNPRIAGKLT